MKKLIVIICLLFSLQNFGQTKQYKKVIKVDVYDNGNIIKYIINGKVKIDTVYHGVNIKEAKEVNIHGGENLPTKKLKQKI